MRRPGILGTNMLIMLGYSLLFLVLASSIGRQSMGEVISVQWAVLGLHILGLFVYGLIRLSVRETRSAGKQLLLASLLVAIVGHGLCFFNGLAHFNG